MAAVTVGGAPTGSAPCKERPCESCTYGSEGWPLPRGSPWRSSLGSSRGVLAVPTPPTGLSATPLACIYVALEWNPSNSSSVPLYGYKLYRNGLFFKWEREPSTSSYDLSVLGGTT